MDFAKWLRSKWYLTLRMRGYGKRGIWHDDKVNVRRKYVTLKGLLHTKENERRRKQIERGMLKVTK